MDFTLKNFGWYYYTFQSILKPQFSKPQSSWSQLMLVRGGIDLIALVFYRVKNTEQIGDVLSRVRAVKNIHLLLEKWRVRQAPQATSEDVWKRFLLEIDLSFWASLIHDRIYLNKKLLSAHSFAHVMQSGVVRCVGIPADATVSDCGLCHVGRVSIGVEPNGKTNQIWWRCWLKQTKPQMIKTNLYRLFWTFGAWDN